MPKIHELLANLQTKLPILSAMDANTIDGLDTYLKLLTKWNKAINLTGIKDPVAIFNELIVDSFYLAEFLATLPLDLEPICYDLGAGAGLPGIPLRLIWTHGTYTLIEIRDKRAIFLAQVLAHLKLKNTFVYRGALQDYFAKQKVAPDLIISRAFWPWPKLGAFLEPRLNNGLWIVLTKEPKPQDNLPNWELVARQSYQVAKSERFFWALHKKS